MPKRITLDFTKDKPSLGGGATDRVPPGLYRLRVTGVSDPGNKSNSGKPMIVVRYSIAAGAEANKRLRDNFVFPASANDQVFGMQRFGGMLMAAGYPVPTDKKFGFDLDNLIGKEVWAEVGDNELPALDGRSARIISQVNEYKLPNDVKAGSATPAATAPAAAPAERRQARRPAPVAEPEPASPFDEAEDDENGEDELEADEEEIAEVSDDEFPF